MSSKCPRGGPRRASAALRSIVLLAAVSGLAAAGGTRAVAQEMGDVEVSVEVRLVSASGQPITGGTLRVLSEGESPRGSVRGRTISLPEGSETVVLRLSSATSHTVEGRARGHRSRAVELGPGELPERLRLVLAVDPYRLPAVRAEGRPGGPSTIAGRADHVMFDRESMTYATVGEWLEDVSGVTLRRRGAGSRQVLSIRGSRPEDVLVLLDGVSLNDPLTGRADLSSLPTSTLESATLLRGVSSARLGSGASAGALLLTSRHVTGSEGGASLRLESPGGVGLDAHAGLGGGNRRLGVSVSASRMTNQFDFENRLLAGAPVETRRNADASALSAALTGARGPVHGTLRVEGAERGVPGRMGTSLFDSARVADRGWAASAGVDGAAGSASGSFRSRVLEYHDEARAQQSSHVVDEARVAGRLRPLERLPITIGARANRESVRGDDLEGRPARTALGAWAAGVVESGRLRIEPAAAVDIAGSAAAFSPEIGVVWTASPSARAWFRIGQGFRLPTFADLYFVTQRRVRPNADLEPERITFDSELGTAGGHSFGSLRFEGSASVWIRRTESPVVWLASSAAVWSPRNLGTLESRGLEVEMGLATGPGSRSGWRVQAAVALENSRVAFGKNRNPLPYAPERSGRLTAEGWWWRNTGGRVDIRHTGTRTTSIAATRSLPAFTTLDLTLSHAIDSPSFGLTILGRIENAFDYRYELTELFPEPGRRLVVRLEARRPVDDP